MSVASSHHNYSLLLKKLEDLGKSVEGPTNVAVLPSNRRLKTKPAVLTVLPSLNHSPVSKGNSFSKMSLQELKGEIKKKSELSSIKSRYDRQIILSPDNTIAFDLLQQLKAKSPQNRSLQIDTIQLKKSNLRSFTQFNVAHNEFNIAGIPQLSSLPLKSQPNIDAVALCKPENKYTKLSPIKDVFRRNMEFIIIPKAASRDHNQAASQQAKKALIERKKMFRDSVSGWKDSTEQ